MTGERHTHRPSTPRGAISIALLCAVSAGPSWSQTAPPATERPSDLGSENPKRPAPGTSPNERSPAQPGDGGQIPEAGVDECMMRLSALGVSAQAATAPLEACIVAMPIRLEHVTARHGSGGAIGAIRFPNRPLIDCRLAEPLARWLGEVVAPVFAASFSSPLTAVRTGPGYECRNRNREATGKPSAHAIGLALDISGFELADGRIVSVGPGNDPASEPVLRTVRTAACGWFTTILGPGSDPMHADHLHVDIQRHGSDERYRICE